MTARASRAVLVMVFAVLTMIAMWQRLPRSRVDRVPEPGYDDTVHGQGLLSSSSSSNELRPLQHDNSGHLRVHGDNSEPVIIAADPPGSPPPVPPVAPPRVFASTADRRECVQRKIYRAFGYDHIPSFFVPGCDHRALWDFAGWAGHEGCGVEPVVGPDPMLVHSAWGGPVKKIELEIFAMIDSFLMTHDTTASKFIFWFIDTEVPPPTSSIISRYRGVAAVEFRTADLPMLAEGTCLQGKPEYLEVPVTEDWQTKGTMGPKEKADMIRLMILHRFGGIWVDTDSVLLRDTRPLFEFAGEFAAKVTMSHYYNNNVLGLRKGSAVAKHMLEFVCQTPYSRDTRNYCRTVGQPCYPKWYWNHGIIQMAMKQKIGLVVVPWSLTDPAYGCFPPMLLSKSGGAKFNKMPLDDVLEHIRGAFVLHTRGYNADKTTAHWPESNYGKLYAKVAAGSKELAPTPVFAKLGSRTPDEQARFRKLIETRGTNVIEPLYLPSGSARVYQLKSTRFKGTCLAAQRPIAIGDSPALELRADCDGSDETTHWAWHNASASIRPALSRIGGGLWGRVMCMAGVPWHNKDDWDMAPSMLNCDPESPSQRWSIDEQTGLVKNLGLGMCVQAVDGTPPFKDGGKPAPSFRRCAPGGPAQKWTFVDVAAKSEISTAAAVRDPYGV